jgi:hypothetical protein
VRRGKLNGKLYRIFSSLVIKPCWYGFASIDCIV